MPRTSNSHQPQQPRVFGFVFLAVIGIIVLQQLQRNDFQSAAESTDPENQLILLPASTFADNIDSWTAVDFTEPDANQNANQKFTSHIWRFQSEGLNGLVAFDQSNWNRWHELTECYRSAGWTLLHRELRKIDTAPSWPCVIATFSKDEQSATLVYSMSYRDGTPLAPLDLSADEAAGTNWLSRMRARLELGRHQQGPDADMLAVQYQVFCSSVSNIDNEATDRILQLHKTTRQRLRKAILSGFDKK